jgi:F-type H+-transporting ATPase subunit b
MNYLLIAAAETGTGENPLKQIADQFGWEPRLFISQCILFLFVAIVLAKFAYNPLLAMLEHRRQQIAEALENAEKTRLELAKAKEKAQEIVSQANVQANKLIEEGRTAANKVREVETQKAIAEAAQIIAKAREATIAERNAELAKLRREVGQLVVRTTAQVTGKILTPEDQKRLVEETTKQLAA